MIACSFSISPSGVLGFAPATVGCVVFVVFVGRSVARRERTVSDSRREDKRVVNLSLAAVGGWRGNRVVCVSGVSCYTVGTVEK